MGFVQTSTLTAPTIRSAVRACLAGGQRVVVFTFTLSEGTWEQIWSRDLHPRLERGELGQVDLYFHLPEVLSETEHKRFTELIRIADALDGRFRLHSDAGGPKQHAKLVASYSGGAMPTRAVVSSANISDSALGQNQLGPGNIEAGYEVLAPEDLTAVGEFIDACLAGAKALTQAELDGRLAPDHRGFLQRFRVMRIYHNFELTRLSVDPRQFEFKNLLAKKSLGRGAVKLSRSDRLSIDLLELDKGRFKELRTIRNKLTGSGFVRKEWLGKPWLNTSAGDLVLEEDVRGINASFSDLLHHFQDLGAARRRAKLTRAEQTRLKAAFGDACRSMCQELARERGRVSNTADKWGREMVRALWPLALEQLEKLQELQARMEIAEIGVNPRRLDACVDLQIEVVAEVLSRILTQLLGRGEEPKKGPQKHSAQDLDRLGRVIALPCVADALASLEASRRSGPGAGDVDGVRGLYVSALAVLGEERAERRRELLESLRLKPIVEPTAGRPGGAR